MPQVWVNEAGKGVPVGDMQGFIQHALQTTEWKPPTKEEIATVYALQTNPASSSSTA